MFLAFFDNNINLDAKFELSQQPEDSFKKQKNMAISYTKNNLLKNCQDKIRF